MEPPPPKKLRPYVTKWERKKAAETALNNSTELASAAIDDDLKDLFITDETVLEYQDKFYKNSLPRKVLKRVQASKECIWSVKWCEKFSHLLAATCGNYVKLFDVMKNDEIKTVHALKHNEKVRYCDWSRSSRQLLTCSVDGYLQVIDYLDNAKIKDKLKTQSIPSCVKWWKDDDNVILVGGDNSFLKSYDIRSGKEVANYKFKCGKILSFDFFLGGSSFMAGGDLVNRQSAEHNLIVWDTRAGAKLSAQIFHERYTCPCITSHPSGAVMLAQTTGNYIARFSTQKPYRLDKFVRYQNHTVNEYPVSFDVSRDGQFVISGSSNGSVVCYKNNNGNFLRIVPLSLTKENEPCIDVQCHPVLPSMVAVSDWAGKIHILK